MRLGALDRLKRYRRVESCQHALVRHRKSEQVDVRELAMSLDVVPAEPSRIAYAYRVLPEDMMAIRTEGPQTRGCIFDRRAPAWVGRIGDDTDQRVLCERTSRPWAGAIASEPGVSRLVMQRGRDQTAQPGRLRQGERTRVA